MPARAFDDPGAGFAERRVRQHRRRIARRDAGFAQRLGGQIKAPERRVLVEVAQDVGELQRAPQMVRQRDAVALFHPEYAHRQAPDRARDPVAIKLERRLVGRADIADHVHLHPVDDGMEILAPQAEIAHRRLQAADARNRRLAGTERVDVGAPTRQLVPSRAARPARIRDVIDLAAKGIDLEHGLALRARQYAHRIVERAARRPFGRRRVRCFCQRQCSRVLRSVAGREQAAGAAGCPPY
jgi:hypothetical protein